MTSDETMANLARSRWLQHLVRLALLGLFLGQLPTVRVCGAEDRADPYDTLYDVLMTRLGPEGKSYGENETGPVIFPHSDFPFGDKTYRKFAAALDAFAALPQSRIEAYSDIKRALLQRHLWSVFDATLPRTYMGHRTYNDRRATVQPQIASLIRRLALTREQILALPDTMAATVKSGDFAQRHHPTDRFKPFLPADLDSKESPWICLGEVDNPVPGNIHSDKLKWRSAFFSFMRVPGGRSETLNWVDKVDHEALPLGTQFAFIERAFLVNDNGALVLSPLTVSISLRAFLRVTPNSRNEPRARQSVAEFVMQPRQLMHGNAVMKALGPGDSRYEAGGAEDISGSIDDPFETGGVPSITRLKLCMQCHSGARRVGLKTARLWRLKENTPEAIINATSERKRSDKTWTTLHELWKANSAGGDAKSSARTDKPQPPFDNSRNAGDRVPAEDADPYEVLYNVIMVRKDSEGTAYGRNEVGPFIYARSRFPFDDETFPKLTAALERFNALPQENIEAYGVVKRALLQRHLWAAFDATMWLDYMPPTHVANRRAAQKALATLIRRVALTKTEILALPDTRAATIKNGGFPQQHDPTDRFKPFLPADLYANDSSWVCMGKVDHTFTDHGDMARWRSVFLQFVRLPEGRKATLEYIKNLNDREVFPVGTQFALIDQAFLISDRGELVLSPFINSIQLRAYLNVTLTDLEARPNPTQCVAEFVMQPRQLMQGKSEMRAVRPKDRRYKTLDVSSGGKVDWFEDHGGVAIQSMPPRLQQCTNCHGRSRPGVRSLGDFNHGDRIADRYTFEAGSSAKIAQAIAAVKREDETWKKLQELWPVEWKTKPDTQLMREERGG